MLNLDLLPCTAVSGAAHDLLLPSSQLLRRKGVGTFQFEAHRADQINLLLPTGIDAAFHQIGMLDLVPMQTGCFQCRRKNPILVRARLQRCFNLGNDNCHRGPPFCISWEDRNRRPQPSAVVSCLSVMILSVLLHPLGFRLRLPRSVHRSILRFGFPPTASVRRP